MDMKLWQTSQIKYDSQRFLPALDLLFLTTYGMKKLKITNRWDRRLQNSGNENCPGFLWIPSFETTV
jgi:hypothetical protein